MSVAEQHPSLSDSPKSIGYNPSEAMVHVFRAFIVMATVMLFAQASAPLRGQDASVLADATTATDVAGASTDGSSAEDG